MTHRDDARAPEKRTGRKRRGPGSTGGDNREPDPGTQGPEGHLDDQPQREDEYLSDVLNEFNPQRKDTPVDKGKDASRDPSRSKR